MEQIKHASYHPSIKDKYTYMIEYSAHFPSKRSYIDPKVCAEEALQLAQTKYKNKIINIHILKDDVLYESLK
jgi:hypothetical protein